MQSVVAPTHPTLSPNSHRFQPPSHAHSLPWVPMRTSGDEGKFQSLIPEDVVAYLQQYVTLSRLGDDTASGSFRDQVHKLEAHIHLSFGAAFKILGDSYARAVKKGPKVTESVARAALASGIPIDWTRTISCGHHEIGAASSRQGITATTDPSKTYAVDVDAVHSLDEDEREQLDEHIEWLCSVANDCRRITENAMIEKAIAQCQLTKQKKDNYSAKSTFKYTSDKHNDKDAPLSSATLRIANVSSKAYEVFNRVCAQSVDFISCIIFKVCGLLLLFWFVVAAAAVET